MGSPDGAGPAGPAPSLREGLVMRGAALVSLLGLTLGALGGCGANRATSRPEETQAIGPRGGVMVQLTDEARAEVVLETPKAAGKSGNVQVVAYFSGPDLRTPLTQPPTDVSVSLAFPEKEEVVALEEEPAAQGGGNRFASKPGPYAVEPLTGSLKATVAGQAITKGFAAAR